MTEQLYHQEQGKGERNQACQKVQNAVHDRRPKPLPLLLLLRGSTGLERIPRQSRGGPRGGWAGTARPSSAPGDQQCFRGPQPPGCLLARALGPGAGSASWHPKLGLFSGPSKQGTRSCPLPSFRYLHSHVNFIHFLNSC